MKSLRWIEKVTDFIPLWVYNLLALLSSLITIITAAFGAIAIFNLKKAEETQINVNPYFLYVIMGLVCIIVILITKVAKYRKLSRSRIKSVSHNTHRLTHSFRDTFLDVLHDYKTGILNISLLSTKVTACLEGGLDALCEILQDFTGHEVSACIKLVECSDNSGKIDIDTAKVRVFCRSENSDQRRKSYDHSPES